MKRLTMFLLKLALLTLSLWALALWVNNVVIAVQWRPNEHGAIYHGFNSWLDWAAVDFSTVATAVPTVVFFMLFFGLRRITHKHEDFAQSYFPLFKGQEEVIVGFGLIGTVQGLIMYGYYKQTNVTMDDLMICMRTALYSTLVALVWAYGFSPWVIPLFRKAYDKTSSGTPAEEQSLAGIISKLSEVVAILTKNLTGAASAATAAEKSLKQAVPEITKTQEKMLDILKQLGEESKERKAAITEISITTQAQQKNIAILQTQLVQSQAFQTQLIDSVIAGAEQLAKATEGNGILLGQTFHRMHSVLSSMKGGDHEPTRT